MWSTQHTTRLSVKTNEEFWRPCSVSFEQVKWIETIGTYSTSWNRSLRFLQDIQRTEGRMSLQVADPLESLFFSLQSTGLTETSSLVNQTLLLVFVKFALKQMSCVINPNKFCQAVYANAQNSGSESFKFWFHVKLGTGFRMQKATWSHKNTYLCALSILMWFRVQISGVCP